MVISIIMVLVGAFALLTLPTAQFPNIAPPDMQVKATYPGADSLTVEQSVAAPIEQQMTRKPRQSKGSAARAAKRQ